MALTKISGIFSEKWSHAGRTDAALEALNVSMNIEQYAQSGAIDDIVTKYLTEPTQTAFSITRPVPGLKEEQDAALVQELAARKDAMSEEEIQALIEETAAFDAWTKANAESNMIDEIKAVDVKTLPEEVQTANVEEETIGGIRYISSFVEEEGMVMPSFYFDASVIPADRLQEYALYTTLLGALDTQDYSREELQERANVLMSNMAINASTIGYEDGSYQPVFTAGWSALSENLEESYALMESILLRTDFSDLEYIRSYLTQIAADARQNYSTQTPHSLAVTIGEAAINGEALYNYRIGALDFLAYLEKVIAMSDGQLGALMQGMDEIRDLLMNRNGLTISCVGNEEIIGENTAQAQIVLDQLAMQQQERVDYTDVLEPLPDAIAVMVEGSVQYNAMVAGMPDESPKDGRYSAMRALVNDQLLLPYLRFENGAYSVMTGITDQYVYVVSYRDPNYALTYDYYDRLGDEIRGLSLTQTELDGYITTAYSSLAMPAGPYTLASEAVNRVMRGETDETLNQMRQLKTFCAEDVQQMADLYEMLGSGVKVTVGSPSLILENADDFDLILDGLINQSSEEVVPAA